MKRWHPEASSSAGPQACEDRSGSLQSPEDVQLGTSAESTKRACRVATDTTTKPMETSRADAVSAVVLAAYRALPKTGKPQPNEHTILAGFAITFDQQKEPYQPVVVALGTGTKCLGGSQRSATGNLINDSHAEVIARRALVRWIYSALSAAVERQGGTPSFHGQLHNDSGAHQPCSALPVEALFELDCDSGLFRAVPGWRLHMCISQLPCGDACIFSLPGNASNDSTGMKNRTGAKALIGGGELPQAANVEAQQNPGAVRRKPGKGDATLSMSCSDKIAKWVLLGVQGALLSSLLSEPLYLSSLTAAASPQSCGNASAEAAALGSLQRAVRGRTEALAARLQDPFRSAPPTVSLSRTGTALDDDRPAPTAASMLALGDDNLVQTGSRTLTQGDDDGLAPTATRTIPSGTSINWSAPASRDWKLSRQGGDLFRQGGDLSGQGGDLINLKRLLAAGEHEVTLSASGRKAGASKKQTDSLKTRSTLCKAALFARYSQLTARVSKSAHNAEHFRQSMDGIGRVESTYRDAKQSTRYSRQWEELSQDGSLFALWLRKDPDQEQFTVFS